LGGKGQTVTPAALAVGRTERREPVSEVIPGLILISQIIVFIDIVFISYSSLRGKGSESLAEFQIDTVSVFL
jgi:hypothetical protein